MRGIARNFMRRNFILDGEKVFFIFFPFRFRIEKTSGILMKLERFLLLIQKGGWREGGGFLRIGKGAAFFQGMGAGGRRGEKSVFGVERYDGGVVLPW